MVTVPPIVPEVPALRADPIVAYMNDLFTRPVPFRADVVLDVTPFVAQIVDMLACHACQVFDWLPYNLRAEVPADPAARRDWLTSWYGYRSQAIADRFREALIATYGVESGSSIQFAEAYEISEYAGQLDPTTRRRLFPWT
jgi:hypothetical protein